VRCCNGGPIAGTAKLVAKKVLGEMPMTPVQEGVQHFFKDLPQPTPPRPVSPEVRLAGSPCSLRERAPSRLGGHNYPPRRRLRPHMFPALRLQPPPAPLQLSTGTAAGNWGIPPALPAGTGNTVLEPAGPQSSEKEQSHHPAEPSFEEALLQKSWEPINRDSLSIEPPASCSKKLSVDSSVNRSLLAFGPVPQLYATSKWFWNQVLEGFSWLRESRGLSAMIHVR
jgi:hypothetical protein